MFGNRASWSCLHLYAAVLRTGFPQGCYRNFRTFTRTADYPQRSIFVVRGKKVQQITRTGLLPAPQNKRKSCYCITGIRTHKRGAMNIPCCTLFTKRKINNAALNTLLSHFWFVLLKRPKYQCINAKTP